MNGFRALAWLAGVSVACYVGPAAGAWELSNVAPPERDGLAAAEAALLRADPPSAREMPSARGMSSVRDVLAGLAEPASKREAARIAVLRRFYEARNFAPLWSRDGAPRPEALALARRLSRAEEDGLVPAHYVSSRLARALSGDAPDMAVAEVELSLSALRYAGHQAAGRVLPKSISPALAHEPADPDPEAVLRALSEADDPAKVLDAFEPPHPEYRALKARLAELRAAPSAESLPAVPEGPTLRVGDASPRVPILRARLQVEASPDLNPEYYDETLAEAVRAFQGKAGLGADGVVGPRTLTALNGASREAETAAILLNMERWRWMPRDLGTFHVLVNVPEFAVRIRRDGAVVHATRVIVGRPETPTPIFSDEMDHIVVNPYWNVPASILTKEMLPAIQADPIGWFEKHGYQVLASIDGKMQPVDPYMIDWWSVDPKALRLRQPPGEENALGQIKFMFPNTHDVYLHDTPTKHLFARDLRAYSHGCVRVDDPLAFADALLAFEPKWNAARLKDLYGGPEKRIDLSRRIPVHLAYFTLTVEPDGTTRRYADLYGFDQRLAQALGIEGAAAR